MDLIKAKFPKAYARTIMAFGALFLACQPALADRISNPVAEFNGLDKITGRITSFDVYIGETVQFGALQVTPRVCYSRDDKEAQRIDAFVEVEEITLDRKIRRIFTGWMFADSPGLNAVEHPIYDVWLKTCKLKSDVPPPEGLSLPDSTPQPEPEKQSPPESASTNTGDGTTTGDASNNATTDGQTFDDLLNSGIDPNGDDGTQAGEGQVPENSPEFESSPQVQKLKPGTGLF